MFRHRVDSTRILPPRPSSTPFVRRSRRAWLSTRTRSCKISLFLILRQSYRTFAHRRKSLVLAVHQLIVPDTHQIHRSRRSLSLAVSELCCMHTESQSATADRLRTAFHQGRRRPKSRRKGHLPYLLPGVGFGPVSGSGSGSRPDVSLSTASGHCSACICLVRYDARFLAIRLHRTDTRRIISSFERMLVPTAIPLASIARGMYTLHAASSTWLLYAYLDSRSIHAHTGIDVQR